MNRYREPLKGYFFGLNERPIEDAFKDFQDECIFPYESKEAALADAEKQRQAGDFFDDNATVQVYYFEIKLERV